MPYAIAYKKSVAKEIRKLAKKDIQAVVIRIQSLAENPHRTGVVKLKGSDELYRIRQGDYRIIFTVKEAQLIILILKIGHRKDVYARG